MGSVDEVIEVGGSRALAFAFAHLESAQDESGVRLVGTGPLEDLIAEHGSALSREIAALTEANPRFQDAIGSVALPVTLGPLAERTPALMSPD
jgi:hypothetical protein